MLQENSASLLEAVKHSEIHSAKGALARGANPNVIDESNALNAVQEAIKGERLDVLNLLLDGISEREVIKGDVNLVGHNFESSISLAARTKQNARDVMEKVISSRELFKEVIFDKYLTICINQISNDDILNENDFALLAHYVSRLCNKDVGTLISQNNNSDKYMVHICEFSLILERDKTPMQGWNASKFLPLRIFSLFEILVKLKKGVIDVSRYIANKNQLFADIKSEILLEIETLRVEQERLAIFGSTEITDDDREDLYEAIAEKFISKLQNNVGREFSLAAGYQGHAIYIAFRLDEEGVYIRYDNVGRGINKRTGDMKDRHHRKDNLVFPREVRMKNIDGLKMFLKKVLSNKGAPLPQLLREGDEGYTKLAAEKKALERMQATEKILSEIYDDENSLKYEEISSVIVGAPEQQTGICTATSHTAGLLVRFPDKDFLKWLLFEEKQCVFQKDRNEGARQAKNLSFWNERMIRFRSPEFFDCCSLEIVDDLLKEINVKSNDEFMELYKKMVKTPLKKQISEFMPLHEESLRLTREYPESQVSKVLCGILSLKIAVLLKSPIGKYLYFEIAQSCFSDVSKNMSDSGRKSEVCYCLGLSNYGLQRYDQALVDFNHSLEISEKLFQSDSARYRGAVRPPVIIEKAILSNGFLNIEKKEYALAEAEFEKTRKTRIGARIDIRGREIPATISYYPVEASLGLGVVECKLIEEGKYVTIDDLETLLNRMIAHFAEVERPKIHPFFSKAREYRNRVLLLLETQQEVKQDLKEEVPAPQAEEQQNLEFARRLANVEIDLGRQQPHSNNADNSDSSSRKELLKSKTRKSSLPSSESKRTKVETAEEQIVQNDLKPRSALGKRK